MRADKPARVAIIGSGPAGCATALALRRALGDSPLLAEVHLYDAGTDNGSPAIGETLPPASRPLLQELGLSDLLEQGPHLPCPGSISVWGDSRPGHNDFSLQLLGCGYHLDRSRFDADLKDAAMGDGCILHQGWRLQHIETLASGFELGFALAKTESGEGDPQVHPADFVIDASGTSAAFARRLGVARNLFDQVLSVCAFYPLPASANPRPAHTLIQATAQGWWYAARLPHERAIISLCTDLDTLRAAQLDTPKAWLAAVAAAQWFRSACEQQFGMALQEPGELQVKTAPSAILSAVVGEHWLAVGDAAASYDSLTSAGITKALQHATLAGQALARYLKGESGPSLQDYQQRVFEDFSIYLGLHQQHYYSEQRFPDSGFWQRRRVMA